jgi:hypothetical protein
MSIKRKLHHLISGQIPEFVRVEYPQFVTFLETYYKFLEEEGEVHDVLLNNEDWMDIDNTLDVFLPYYRAQFTYDIPSDTIIDNRRLIKYINQYYEAKGSENATEMFFRFMFNDTATVKYPGDYILRASDGKWSRKRFIKVETTKFSTNNIFEVKGSTITLTYLEYIAGAGSFQRSITTRCLDVYETSRPVIYQLEVDINPNYTFPEFINPDENLAISLGNYDTHVYVQKENVTYGTISKQITGVVSIDEPGSKFFRDDSFIVSETGVEGLYFAGDYTVNVSGPAAYVFETLQNNAIIRVSKTTNTFAEQYFLQDYTIFGDYASAPTRGKIKLLSVVDTGERFLVRKSGVITSVTVLDGGSGYISGSTGVSLVGNGTGAQFRVLVSNGKITQVSVLNGGSNYTEATLTPTGAGVGAVFEVNISEEPVPVNTFTVDFTNGRAGVTSATVTFQTGHIYHAPGEFKDNAGFTSDIVNIQDNNYYQPYSYSIETTEPLGNWKETYLQSTHPAGFKMFANLILEGNITVPSVSVSDEFTQINLFEDLPYREVEETLTVSDNSTLEISKVVTDTIAATDNISAVISINRSLTDTISSSDSISKNISDVLTDGTTTSDTLTINYSDVLTDSTPSSDALAFNISKTLTDTVSLSDSIVNNFTQLNDATSDLQEDLALTDTTSLSVGKIASDELILVTDAVVLAPNLQPSDTIFSSDTLNSINTSLTFTDTVTVSDLSIMSYDQQNDATSDLQEDLSLGDSVILNVGNVTTDTFGPISDSTTISFAKNPSETISTTETVSYTLSDVLVDTFTVADVPSLSFSTSFSESITNSDNVTIEVVITQSASDTVTTSDSTFVINTNKTATDTTSVTDAGGTIWVDSYFVNGRFSASPYVGGDYVGTSYSL